ncbi:MAG: 1-acyl-sn-glycerol-3-phosphate acyltransferase [Clostridia bacterium]|nr:1-acyl-sn-glycerol-3-phosphate acyltransferase [Clostridia bacterium]
MNNKKKKPGKYGNFLYDFVKVTGAIPALLWMRPKVITPSKTKRPKGGYMLSANHCTLLDPIFILCAFPTRRIHSLATKDLYKNRWLSWFLPRMHCIQVDKENFSLDSFHEVVRRLKEGKVICIYPEGQVNRNTEELLTFKSGVILMAHRAKVPIVPVYLVPPEKWYSRRVAVVGEPINVRALCGDFPTEEDMNRASAYVHQKEQELKEYYEAKTLPSTPKEQSTAEKKEEEVMK